MKTILAKKIGMTQIFSETGAAVPVTILDATGASVSKHLSENAKSKDQVTHYEVGIGQKKNANKADLGQYKSVKQVPTFKQVVKIQPEAGAPELGSTISVDIFQLGDKVNATAITKGKGFQGVMKRHGFKGGPKTHGGPTGKKRSGGSIGSGTTPGHVIKGMKMPGRMGGVTRTVENLKVAFIDTENNLIGLAGAVPGSKKGYVQITESRYNKRTE